MTDPKALADADFSGVADGSYAPGYTESDHEKPDWDNTVWDNTVWDNTVWGDFDWDDDRLNDWQTYAVERPQPPPAAPWFRNPRLLFGLITVATASLVVATVLLITGKESGEIPTAPQLSTRTTPTSARSAPPVPVQPAPPTPSSSASAESSSPSVEEPAPVMAPEQPAEVPAELPAEPPPTASATKSPAGPKINVTRTPMSFTPGKH